MMIRNLVVLETGEKKGFFEVYRNISHNISQSMNPRRLMTDISGYDGPMLCLQKQCWENEEEASKCYMYIEWVSVLTHK